MGILEDIAAGAQSLYNNAQKEPVGAVIGAVQGSVDYVQKNTIPAGQDIANDSMSALNNRFQGNYQSAQNAYDNTVSGLSRGIDDGFSGARRVYDNTVAGLNERVNDSYRSAQKAYDDSGMDDFVEGAGKNVDKIKDVVKIGVPVAIAVGVGAAVLGKKAKTSTTRTTESGASKSNEIRGGADHETHYVEQKGDLKATYTQDKTGRAGSTDINDLGFDRKTWSLIAEGYTPLQAVTMRLQEEKKPSVKRELDWQQGKLLQNDIEASSAEHHYKADSLNPADWTPNTRENVGDMALTIKQGSRVNRKSQLSDSNPEIEGILSDLPGGYGQEDISWDSAKTGFTKESPSLLKAVNTLESARKSKDMGVYGLLSPNRDMYDVIPKETYTKNIRAKNDVNYGAMDVITGTQNEYDRLFSNTGRNYLGLIDKDQGVGVGSFGKVKRIPKSKKKPAKSSDKFMNEILYGTIPKKKSTAKKNNDLMNEILHGTSSKSRKTRKIDYSNIGI